MFILPLMAILFGLEFYLVFERTTTSYERDLKEGYSMLVVTTGPISLETLKKRNKHILSSEKIERKSIVSEIAKGVSADDSKEILKALPYFYSVRLDAYLGTGNLDAIKKDLEGHQNIKSVETFGSSYSASYKLFSFIKLSLKIFIFFMFIVSLFLIIKQMEIWKYAHRQRMSVMKIFGAPLMLRSGILFRVAFFDAILATLFTSVFFFYLKFKWVSTSGIEMMVQNQEALFRISDISLLLVVALLIVIVAVATVVLSKNGVEE